MPTTPAKTVPWSDRGGAEPVVSRLESFCEGVIEAGWLATLLLVPVYFNVYSKQSFDLDKAVLFRVIVLLMVAAWVLKVATGGRPAAPRPSAEPGLRAWLRVPLFLPTVVLLSTTIASAALSVSRWESFAGSYARGQGVWTQLSYAAIFALTIAHLRTAAQWRRIVYAVAVASFAVSSYAVLQRLDLDPVLWITRELRVGATLGNPIFLAGFLLFVVFLTAREVGARWPGRSGGETSSVGADVPTLVILLYNLVLQALAVVFAQSRGPMLGLLAGSFVGTLALVLDRREREPGRAGWRTKLRRHAWLALLVLALALLGVFVAGSRAGIRAAKLTLPNVGRLTTPFDLKSSSARVRMLIWGGGVDLTRDLVALEPSGDAAAPGAAPAPARALLGEAGGGVAVARLLLGYGPETFLVAYSRVQPVEIAGIDNPDTVPDRGHNELLDRVVQTGMLGSASWVWWYGALLFTALTGVFPRAALRGHLYWGLLASGALAGALAPATFGLRALGFFGVTVGLLAATVIFLAYVAVRPIPDQPPRDRTSSKTLSLALLATAVAHLVEISLGISVISTSAYLWFFAAVLVVVERDWLALDVDETEARQDMTPLRSAMVAGLLAGLVVATLAFAFLPNWLDASSAAGVVVAAAGSGMLDIAGGAFWLPLLSWMAAGVLAPSLERRPPKNGALLFAVTSLATAGALVSYQASRLSGSVRLRDQGAGMSEIIGNIAHHATAFAVLVLVWTLVAGAALGVGLPRRRWLRDTNAGRGWRVALVAAAVTAALVPAIAATLRRPIADAMVKNAAALAAGGNGAAVDILRRAAALVPRDPAFELERGRALVAAARATESAENRAAWLQEARVALENANRLAPLHPDHLANLARLASIEADFAGNESDQRERLDTAARAYAEALAMRPPWVRLVVEYAVLEYRRDQREHALALLDEALALDPREARVYGALAQLHAAEALSARLAGNTELEAVHTGKAQAAAKTRDDIEKFLARRRARGFE